MDEDLKLPDHVEKALDALDRDATRRAGQVDAARVADGVLRRLSAEPAVTVAPSRGRRWLIGLAAAVALLLISSVMAKRMVAPRDILLPVASLVQPLDSAQQQALLVAIDDAQRAAAELGPAASVSLDDLTEQELETLLRTMENGEGSL